MSDMKIASEKPSVPANVYGNGEALLKGSAPANEKVSIFAEAADIDLEEVAGKLQEAKKLAEKLLNEERNAAEDGEADFGAVKDGRPGEKFARGVSTAQKVVSSRMSL